jgi:GTP1/Obg family GTP-binding protein
MKLIKELSEDNQVLLLSLAVSVILNIVLFISLQDMSRRAAYHLEEQTKLEQLYNK